MNIINSNYYGSGTWLKKSYRPNPSGKWVLTKNVMGNKGMADVLHCSSYKYTPRKLLARVGLRFRALLLSRHPAWGAGTKYYSGRRQGGVGNETKLEV